MKKRHFVVATVICLFLCDSRVSGQSASSQTASTQSASTQPSSEGWEFRLIPYLWGTSINGQVGIGDRTANVDASFRNILHHLHFGVMGLVDATWNKKFVVLNDVVYTDLRGFRAFPGPFFPSVTPNQKFFLLTPEGGYRLLDTSQASLDVLGGIRYWHLNTELQFQPGFLPGVDVQASRGWVDGILALKGKVYLPHTWWLTGYGDVGGGGSNITFQFIGMAGVDFHKRYALLAGYRYLNVDYDKDKFLFDTSLKGPVIGFTFKF